MCWRGSGHPRALWTIYSSIVALPLTVVQEDLLSVAAWYDNEIGYM